MISKAFTKCVELVEEILREDYRLQIPTAQDCQMFDGTDEYSHQIEKFKFKHKLLATLHVPNGSE